MRNVFDGLLICTAVAVGVALYLRTPADPHGATRAPEATPEQERTFAPLSQEFGAAVSRLAQADGVVVDAAVVVTSTEAQKPPQPDQPAASPVPAAPSIPQANDTLVRDLQTELARVGCLAGTPTGAWDDATVRAADELMRRAKAGLPANEPGAELLALVRSQPSGTCTDAASAALEASAPIADAEAAATPPSTAQTATRASRTERRMSLGGDVASKPEARVVKPGPAAATAVAPSVMPERSVDEILRHPLGTM